jgi:hypothetical protein
VDCYGRRWEVRQKYRRNEKVKTERRKNKVTEKRKITGKKNGMKK